METVLVKRCPEMPTDAAQVNVVFDDPALGRRSKENLERAIRAFLAWAEERHGCPNPLRGVKWMPKTRTLPRVLRASEVAAIWRACATSREKAMIALLLDTGIRLGDLTGLRWEDVGADCLRVGGKTGPRVIPVTPEVREMLKDLGDAAHIWASGSGKGPFSRSAVQMGIKRIFQRAGLNGPKMGPHILRHTFATQYISSGGSLPHLQKLLGHTSITTTEIYLHLSAEALRADHAKHSPVRCVLEGKHGFMP